MLTVKECGNLRDAGWKAAHGFAHCDMGLRRRIELRIAVTEHCGTIDSQLSVLCVPALLAGKLSRSLRSDRPESVWRGQKDGASWCVGFRSS